MDHIHAPFTDPAAVASYTANAPSQSAGARRSPSHGDADAHMLIVGAGGGMETRAMAEAQPAWRFTGVDPSPAMLGLARQTLTRLRVASI